MNFSASDIERTGGETVGLPWSEAGVKRSVWLDISRLVWRARHLTPSGIDRVELAYARHFLDHGSRTARFIARINAIGGRELDRAAVRDFLDGLDGDWSDSRGARPLASIARLLSRSRAAPNPETGITIIPSHQNWHRAAWLKQRRGRGGRLVLFLHDAIPSDYPEYARAGGARRHDERLTHALQMADALIVNSRATGDALARFARAKGHPLPRLCVASLGTRVGRAAPSVSLPEAPYFLCVGTIEPRKNHMLLLLLWRQMAEAGIADLPKLVIVGRRGWENEQVVDLLDRSRALRGLVEERNDIGDAELWALMAGARALLMPSFAEGYGMPVAEALAAGTPVIASDLPVYREVAAGIPEFRNPLDGPGWQSAILDYAQAQSPRREAQLARLRAWRPPTWADHFRRVEGLLEELDR